MTINWGRVAQCAAAAGAAALAWKKLGESTRGELKLRAQLAGSTLLGNPVAYRVTLLKEGTGPGIAVNAAPSMISHCTVVGVQGGAGMYVNTQGDAPWGPGEDDEPEDECEGQDDDEEDEDGASVSEMKLRPNVVPATCENGHLSYPPTVVLHDRSEYRPRTDTKLGTPCPQCGAERVIPAGVYRAGDAGYVYRAGDVPAEEDPQPRDFEDGV